MNPQLTRDLAHGEAGARQAQDLAGVEARRPAEPHTALALALELG